MLLNFQNTELLIQDIETTILEYKIDDHASEIFSLHIIKVAILTFASELENDLKLLVSRHLVNYSSFCSLCNKLRNPKFSDIKAIISELSLNTISLEDAEKQVFTNIMQKRDKVAHSPSFNHEITLLDIKKGVQIGKKIINHFLRATTVGTR